MLHYYLLYYLPEDIWIMDSVLCCIYVQTKPLVLLLNFRASRKQRKFGFILCHVCTQPMPTSILFLSGITLKLRKTLFNLFPNLYFLFIVGPWPSVKMCWLLLVFFWEELSLCASGSSVSVFISQKGILHRGCRQNSWSQLRSSHCPLGSLLISSLTRKNKTGEKAAECQLIRKL